MIHYINTNRNGQLCWDSAAFTQINQGKPSEQCHKITINYKVTNGDNLNYQIKNRTN